MATLVQLVDGVVPVAADFNNNFVALNTETRPTTTGGTGIASYTTGDVLYASATNTLSPLAIGTRGKVLTVAASSIVSWQLAPAPGYVSRLLGVRTSTTVVTYTADGLVLVNASGHPVYLSSVSVTGTITTSGAGGLDTGTEGADTWYYVWVIYNDTTVSGLLSVSATIGAITLPTGYTFARLVGAVRNDGSSNFINFRQVGDRIFYAGDTTDGPRNVFTNTTGQTSYTLVDIAAFIPASRVCRLFGTMGGDQAGATSGMAISPNSSGEYASIALGDSTGSTVMMGYAGAWSFNILWISGTGAYWRSPATTATAFRLGIAGFDMDL